MRSTPLWLRALLALVPLGAAQDCTTYAIRGFTARISAGPLNISVLLENGVQLFIYGAGFSELVIRKEKEWHDIFTKSNGSMHCVMSPTLWEGEKCSKYHYWLTLRSNATTLWKLGCSAGCSNLLEKVILGLDALPATFHWRPQDTSLGLWIQGKGFEKNFSVTNTWHDLSVSPDGDESLCRVHSQSLKFSVPCYHNATERDYLRFGEKGIGQSLFALDCVKNSVFGDWEVPVILLSLGILLLLLLVFLLRVRKGRRARKGVFPPEKDQRYTSLPFRSPPTPQDAKGGLRDLLDPQRGQVDDPEEDEEHVYCYMDMEVLRRQLGRDRQAAEQEQQEDLGAVSLSSHDSINSLYYELKAIEKMRGRGGRGEKEYEEEDSYEEVDRGEEKKDGDEELRYKRAHRQRACPEVDLRGGLESESLSPASIPRGSNRAQGGRASENLLV
ncbi:hypothetical protein C7M84_002509 [Penaeus vannamei]|uniref:Uncharacterized protein n=1 Tax=Penaeus vannamei TaxID=6689 RepID=A0A423TQP5_PENVA|nr:hypothetical protein C7M84_002509 [Penaeus vannamei]